MSSVTIKEPVFDEGREHPGFNCSRARIGRQVGSKKVGASLWELPEGQAAYPYHWHVAEEELLIVLDGAPSLRTPDGWRDLAEGEVVSFPCGEEGAHQIVNRTEKPVRFLAVSNQQTDIIVRPDSQTIAACERPPEGGGIWAHFRLADQVDYFEGEEEPA
ncbi:MAG TPA: cupin domain-containing protein [Solirubrobacterales bacterium]